MATGAAIATPVFRSGGLRRGIRRGTAVGGLRAGRFASLIQLKTAVRHRCSGGFRTAEANYERMITLAKKLGTPEHHSLLLRRAREVGLHGTAELIGLAIARGCRHYGGGSEQMTTAPPSRKTFSDEELAVALLSPCLAYSPRALRVGAQMMGSRRNQPSRVALLARREKAENVVRHIAAAGQQIEPQELFWQELLAALPPVSPFRSVLPPGVLPHPSRFRSETGLTNPFSSVSGDRQRATWLRPSSAVSA